MRKLLYNLLILLLAFSLFACGELNPAVGKPTPPDTPGDGTGTETPDAPDDGDSVGYEFSVSFILGGAQFIPSTPVTVQWSGANGIHRAETDQTGVARVGGLDGNYNVTLLNLPSAYMYNPNIYVATNIQRDIVIEIFDIVTVTDRDKGANYNDDVIDLTRTGHYRLTLTSAKPVYYQFSPRSSGYYVIESWVDVTGNNINPIANQHEGSHAYKNPTPIVCNTGGESSTYTKNFRLVIEVAPSNLSSNGGVILCFGIYATLRDGEISKENPVTVDFSIEYRGSVLDPESNTNILAPRELPTTETELTVWNETLAAWHERYSSAGTLHEVTDLGTKSGSMMILNDNVVEYNPDTGFYHLYSPIKYPDTNGFGPILYAHITSNTIFIDSPLNMIEYAGNKALTVSQGTENYKMFIEGYSALIVNEQANNPQGLGPYFCTNTCPCRGSGYLPNGSCPGSCPESCEKCDPDCRHLPRQYENTKGYAQFANSDGLCPVTKELYDFLQKFATSQLLFKDGYGHAETVTNPPFTAYEGSQWLFACAYYE